jgi:deoxyribodipyrimidine photo-lyase
VAPGTLKTGPLRARFMLEAAMSLRESLRSKGSDLIVRVAPPEDAIPALAAQHGVTCVYTHR